MMSRRLLIVSILISMGLIVPLSFPSSAPTAGKELLVLRAEDQANDCFDMEGSRSSPLGGDLIAAELVCERILIENEAGTGGEDLLPVYAPVSLMIEMPMDLTGGAVQLCLFIHIPPIYIEQIICRDSFFASGTETGERIVLSTASGTSLTTGLDRVWDTEIETFKKAGYYRSLFFSTDPEQRIIALEKSRKFDLFRDGLFRFPSPPPLYWKKIPPLKATTSLVVREIENGVPGGLEGLYHDKMDSDWTVMSVNFEVDSSRLLLK